MLIPMVIISLGLLLLVVGFWKFGLWRFRSNMFSRGGAVGLTGMALLVAGIIYGDICWKGIQDRKVFDAKLVELFNRAPDRVDLKGRNMDDFHGVAYVNGKAFEVKTKWLSANDSGRRYQVIAVPITKP